MPLNIFQNIINWFKTPVEQAAGGPDPRLAAAVTFSVALAAAAACNCDRGAHCGVPAPVEARAEVWGHIALPGGIMLPINHWENLIGRAKGADILINYRPFRATTPYLSARTTEAGRSSTCAPKRA